MDLDFGEQLKKDRDAAKASRDFAIEKDLSYETIRKAQVTYEVFNYIYHLWMMLGYCPSEIRPPFGEEKDEWMPSRAGEESTS